MYKEEMIKSALSYAKTNQIPLLQALKLVAHTSFDMGNDPEYQDFEKAQQVIIAFLENFYLNHSTEGENNKL
jgi:hypothetical protein